MHNVRSLEICINAYVHTDTVAILILIMHIAIHFTVYIAGYHSLALLKPSLSIIISLSVIIISRSGLLQDMVTANY